MERVSTHTQTHLQLYCEHYIMISLHRQHFQQQNLTEVDTIVVLVHLHLTFLLVMSVGFIHHFFLNRDIPFRIFLGF